MSLLPLYWRAAGRSGDGVTVQGTTAHLVTDHLVSVRLVVDTATGQVAQRLDDDAWGGIIHDTTPGFQPFGFAGGLYDQHTGLTHFGAREYAAATGRWLQKDPIGFAGGDANVYAYVGNDPVNFVDPSGLSALGNLILRRMLGGYGAVFGGLGVMVGLMLAYEPTGFLHCFIRDGLYKDVLVGMGHLSQLKLLPGWPRVERAADRAFCGSV